MRLDLDKLASTRGRLSIPGGRLEVSRFEAGKVELERPGPGRLVGALSELAVAALVRLGDTRLRLASEGVRLEVQAGEEGVQLTELVLPALSVTDLTVAQGPLRGTSPSVQLVGCLAAATVGRDRGVSVDRLSVERATVRRPAFGLTLSGRRFQLQQEGATELADFELSVSTAGQARVRLTDLDGSGLALVEAEHSVHLDVTAHRLSVERGEDGAVVAEVGRLELSDVKVGWGRVGVEVDRVEIEGLNFERTPQGEVALSAAGLSLSGLELTQGAATLRLGRITLPRGITLSGPDLEIAEILFEQATLEIDPIELTGGGGGLELPFLDALNGRLHADITLDVTAPVLGRRRATHAVRLNIDSGTIDFKKLENDLALLENSVLDFEVQGDTLILEKDLPLIPFDNTTLVSWHLPDEEERELARRNRVRLRRLLDYRMADDDDHAIEVELHRLELSDIDLSLDLEGLAVIALGAAGEVHLGGDDRPGMVDLIASGTLCHDAESPETTEIELSLREINGHLPTFSVGGLTVKSGLFRLGGVERARVSFSGFVPQRVGLTITDGAIRELCLSYPP